MEKVSLMRYALTILDSVLHSALRNQHSAIETANFFMDDTTLFLHLSWVKG